MFDRERFVEECRVAARSGDARAAIREIVARTVSAPDAVVAGLGEPQRSGIDVLYRGDDLTILNLCWGPRMFIRPHDHRMWAVIGIYGGREENAFYRRTDSGLAQASLRELNAKDVALLGETTIHAVTNPLDRITAAIHVYGGDFFAVPRSEWDAKTFEERPYDAAATLRAFEEANARL